MNPKPYFLLFACIGLFLACSSDDADELQLNDCPITQGISPNNDGLNDNFDLSCLAERTGIANLEIFDRNGIQVYERANYIDEFVGKNNDGDDLVTGTYFYVISFQAEDPEYGSEAQGSLYINVEQ